MDERFEYKLSAKQKSEIAQNLIDILYKNIRITDEAKGFVCNWILTVGDEKRKAFFDVWDIVLKNYFPKTRPILFRACNRISKNGKISSFTANLDCAKRFGNGNGLLIICDTKEILQFEKKLYSNGDYRNTFYPLVDVLKRAKKSGDWGFSDRILNNFIGEDEYIMRINHKNINTFRWHKLSSKK